MLNKIFSWVCIIIAIYFFAMFQWSVGLPPKGILDNGNFVLLALFVFFLLLPFAKTLKIGNFFEYSAKIEEIKSEVRDFKSETRELLSLQNSLINNVSQNMSNNVHINIPSTSSALKAEEKLNKFVQSSTDTLGSVNKEADDVFSYISENNGDSAVSLMRLRIELERQLRRILDKEISFKTGGQTRKYLGLMSLWKLFVAERAERKNLEAAFRYVIDICNAAAHGQSVPPGNAQEAIFMGLRVLDILSKTN